MAEWEQEKMAIIAEIDNLAGQVISLVNQSKLLLETSLSEHTTIMAKFDSAKTASPVDASVVPLIDAQRRKIEKIGSEIQDTLSQVEARSELAKRAGEQFSALMKGKDPKEAVNAAAIEDLQEVQRVFRDQVTTLSRLSALCQSQLLELDQLDDTLDRLLKLVALAN